MGQDELRANHFTTGVGELQVPKKLTAKDAKEYRKFATADGGKCTQIILQLRLSAFIGGSKSICISLALLASLAVKNESTWQKRR